MVMHRDPTGDALHLALASYHECDFLLTWNVQHLANANKFSHIRRINALLGLFTPALVTPLELLPRRETMQDDPAITGIHKVRHRISEQFDHDPKKLVEHYMRLQAQYRDHLLGLAKGEDSEKVPTEA
jgi:hypothetical protein